MRRIIDINEATGCVSCEAGVILEDLEKELEKNNMTIPVDLGAKGSCHIGGLFAANAGGVHYLRYGSLHGSILGLEVVLPDGTILDNLNILRKDNTGYDLKQLFVGSEGTLGMITKCSFLCPPKSNSKIVAFFGLDSFPKILELLKVSKRYLGEVLSAFELMDTTTMNLVLKHITDTKFPLSQEFPFYILVEISGSNLTHDEEKMNSFVEHVMSQGMVLDGTMAQDYTQMKGIWKLRENSATALAEEGHCFKYDISLPLENFYEIVEVMKERVGDKGITCGYGHVGDGNVHLTVVSEQNVANLIEPYVYEYVKEKRGSISAEHGIGLMKAKALKYSKSQESIEYMKKIKKIFDPNGILNPYKVLD